MRCQGVSDTSRWKSGGFPPADTGYLLDDFISESSVIGVRFFGVFGLAGCSASFPHPRNDRAFCAGVKDSGFGVRRATARRATNRSRAPGLILDTRAMLAGFGDEGKRHGAGAGWAVVASLVFGWAWVSGFWGFFVAGAAGVDPRDGWAVRPAPAAVCGDAGSDGRAGAGRIRPPLNGSDPRVCAGDARPARKARSTKGPVLSAGLAGGPGPGPGAEAGPPLQAALGRGRVAP